MSEHSTQSSAKPSAAAPISSRWPCTAAHQQRLSQPSLIEGGRFKKRVLSWRVELRRSGTQIETQSVSEIDLASNSVSFNQLRPQNGIAWGCALFPLASGQEKLSNAFGITHSRFSIFHVHSGLWRNYACSESWVDPRWPWSS